MTSGAKWEILHEEKKDEGALTNEKIIEILLSNRGIKTKKEKEDYLSPKLENVTLETVGIKKTSVKKTIDRIKQAAGKNEKIVIYGDYDVDGICGTAILWESIYSFYKNVIPYIPHRVDEGYGLSNAGIDNILNLYPDTKLIITVDNGIVAQGPVSYAQEKSIDVIITDHHVAGDKLPKAFAIVHTTKICGSAVAYLLSQAIRVSPFAVRKNEEQKAIDDEPDSHLELVALATIADLVPLVEENRVFVKSGIESLRKTKRPGLLALFEEAGIKREEIDAYKIGHIIAPRLNAAGRIMHALDSLRLVCTKDRVRAQKLAAHLSATNKQRQNLTEESTLHAAKVTLVSEKIIFVHDEKYNPGIIGLIASRLVEAHYLPAIVVSVGEKTSKGSVRSVAGFNIIAFLRQFSSMVIDIGGHPMAAGFTIETERIEEFKKVLFREAEKNISDDLLQRKIKIDMELPFSFLDLKLYLSLQKLAPFGQGNPEPLFVSKNVRIEDVRFVGRDKKHASLIFSQNGKLIRGIYFNCKDKNLKKGDAVNIAYSLEKDDWNGNGKVQLKIRDIRF